MIADLGGLWGSSMQVMYGRPKGIIFQDDKEASGILKIIKSLLHLELVYYSRSTTHFISLALKINNVLVYLVKNTCGRKK